MYDFTTMVFGWIVVVLVAILSVFGVWHMTEWTCDSDNTKCRRTWFLVLTGLFGAAVGAAVYMNRDKFFGGGGEAAMIDYSTEPEIDNTITNTEI